MIESLPFDISVIMPTLLRDTLLRSVRSIFTQDYQGRIQIIIGIDKPLYDNYEILDILEAECPDNMAITLLNHGYSTFTKNGGVHKAMAGSLRPSMIFLANSRHITFLDDDDLYLPNHLRLLKSSIDGYEFAFSYRIYMDENGNAIAPDVSDSMGLHSFINLKDSDIFYPAYANTNSIMIDKLACHAEILRWMQPLDDCYGEDRRFIDQLFREYRFNCTNLFTSLYRMNKESYYNHPIYKKSLLPDFKPLDVNQNIHLENPALQNTYDVANRAALLRGQEKGKQVLYICNLPNKVKLFTLLELLFPYKFDIFTKDKIDPNFITDNLDIKTRNAINRKDIIFHDSLNDVIAMQYMEKYDCGILEFDENGMEIIDLVNFIKYSSVMIKKGSFIIVGGEFMKKLSAEKFIASINKNPNFFFKAQEGNYFLIQKSYT